jgi:hypothetical protein
VLLECTGQTAALEKMAHDFLTPARCPSHLPLRAEVVMGRTRA